MGREERKAHDNIEFIFGAAPEGVFAVPGKDEEARALSQRFRGRVNESATLVVGLHLDMKREVLGAAARRLRLPEVRGTLRWFEQRMLADGLGARERVAVLPDPGSARYCFDYSDADTHRFLVDDVLYQRRYALALFPRTLMRIYRLGVMLFGRSEFLHRCVYVQLGLI